jgi:T-box protein 20
MRENYAHKMLQINNYRQFFFPRRDPMDALLLEQHLRSPLGLFPDPMMAQLMQPQSMDAALLEKARQHLQMWGRTPYAEMLLPQMYQRPNINAAALNFGLWQGQFPPQLAAGFLNNQAALQQAVAAQQQQQQARSPPPTGHQTPNSQSGSPSPSDTLRSKHFAPRFSPYQIPPAASHTQISPQQQPIVTIKPSPSPSRASPEH